MRNKEALARDQWASNNAINFNASTLGTENPDYYLRNRLETAFMDGIEAGKKIALERISETLKETIK